MAIEIVPWCRAARMLWVCTFLGALGVSVRAAEPRGGTEPFRIEVRDAENGWPVPMMELTTTHHVRFVTDNAGVIAFDLPELMQRETWFSVTGHGYEVAADGFRMRGVRLTPEPGGRAIVKVRRTNLAKRLGRITGAGLFAESQRFGEHLDEPESGVLGCDSVQVAAYRGGQFWLWGDTTVAHYPLGLFHTLGATTGERPLGRMTPPLSIRYEYFRDDASQRVRNIAQLPGDGPTWLSGLVSLPDAEGEEHLVACYDKIAPPLRVVERGLCEWDPAESRFEVVKVLWRLGVDGGEPPGSVPTGHAVFGRGYAESESATPTVMFGDPFPTLEMAARYEAWRAPDQWRSLEVIGELRTSNWESVRPHRGTIGWHPKREKWVTIFCQEGGDASYLGELWYAEADQPSGPWERLNKVVSHSRYTFYNPCLHLEWCDTEPGKDGQGVLLFEATYTSTFSKTESPTPRYDYNQVLYRLDLADLP